MVSIKLVSNKEELEGIQALQQQNLRKNLTEIEAEEQGFLMAGCLRKNILRLELQCFHCRARYRQVWGLSIPLIS